MNADALSWANAVCPQNSCLRCPTILESRLKKYLHLINLQNQYRWENKEEAGTCGVYRLKYEKRLIWEFLLFMIVVYKAIVKMLWIHLNHLINYLVLRNDSTIQHVSYIKYYDLVTMMINRISWFKLKLSSEYVRICHMEPTTGVVASQAIDRFAGIHRKGGGANDSLWNHFDFHWDISLADVLR